MEYHGFLRVAAASPRVKVADCQANAADVIAMMTRAESEGVSVLVFPELCLTGYTCADLFHQHTLLRGAKDALRTVIEASTASFSGVALVGLPLIVDEDLFNCAAVINRGELVGIVPKSFIPNYKEFYEIRWFTPAARAVSKFIDFDKELIPFGTDLLFESDIEGLTIGVEICEDLWVPIPPSCFQAVHGATVLCNLSASNEIIGKVGYRRQLIRNQSGRCVSAYVYSSCGVTESTTDVVFGGHCVIAENAALLAETERFQRDETMLIADVDLERIRIDRIWLNSFGDAHLNYAGTTQFRKIPITVKRQPLGKLHRSINAHPFVPSGTEQLKERCQEIFSIQVAGLAKRVEHIGKPPVTIGVSGGLDSTLALLVTCKTFDRLGVSREKIKAFTMPGFGTSKKTKSNSLSLMEPLGVSISEVDICQLCLDQMRALGHKPFGLKIDNVTLEVFIEQLKSLSRDKLQDLVFENVQARMRTSMLMNSGFVIGTGDVSELALGWCTYNADHMSMYNPNVSIPKTLVKFLVRWIAENEFDGETRKVLLDIVETEISPELLPTTGDGDIGQSTEDTIGPYELHDFFLFYFLRYGASPEKILFLANQAKFDKEYSDDEIRKWLRLFIRRFFTNQFKRSCLPDGPKVGSISLSPRGDWRMPSDAQVNLWLQWVGQ